MVDDSFDQDGYNFTFSTEAQVSLGVAGPGVVALAPEVGPFFSNITRGPDRDRITDGVLTSYTTSHGLLYKEGDVASGEPAGTNVVSQYASYEHVGVRYGRDQSNLLRCPDTITTFYLYGFSMHSEHGLAISKFDSNPANNPRGHLKVFKPVFIEYTLPPSAIRSEQFLAVITVYNYLDTAEEMTFTLKLDSGLKPLPCPGSTESSTGGWECEMSTDNSTDLLNREMDVLAKYSFIAKEKNACDGASFNLTDVCL